MEGRPREQPKAAKSCGLAATLPRRHAATPARLDDVWRVATPRALRVVSVDGTPLDRRERVLHVARLVERVRVDGHRHVVRVGEVEARVDRSGRRTWLWLGLGLGLGLA